MSLSDHYQSEEYEIDPEKIEANKQERLDKYRAKLMDVVGDKDEVERIIASSREIMDREQYKRLDSANKVVMAKCSGTFVMDEGGDVPHWTCALCGWGKYSAIQPSHQTEISRG